MLATPSPLRTALLAALSLVAFAMNSILCRWALGRGTIDAASFTTIRIASGALALALLVRGMRGMATPRGSARGGSQWGALWLFLYAISFSLAYDSLTAGTGALLLFGAVQVTMLLSALRAGERPRVLEWLGLATAIAGLAYLVWPGVSAPKPVGSALMVLAGIAWGLYSLLGRGNRDPILATSGNFLRAVPLTFATSLLLFSRIGITLEGVALAAVSGALTSGLGYVVWYAALPGLTTTRAATLQLSVPILTATLGVVFISEAITQRLVFASIAVLGGIGLAFSARR